MTEEQFKLEARLSAIEYMIQHLLAVNYRMTGATTPVLDLNEQQAADQVRLFTIPGLDAAKADIFTDEMGQHIMSMLRSAREQYGQ